MTQWVALFCALLATGCSQENASSATRRTTERPQGTQVSAVTDAAESPLSRCLVPDFMQGNRHTLVYSDFGVDTAYTGDISGVRMYIHRDSSGWSGDYQEAAGEWGSVHPGVEIDLNEATGSLSLNVPHGPDLPDTTRFQGTISCDSIWGTQTIYKAQGSHHIVYKREAPPAP